MTSTLTHIAPLLVLLAATGCLAHRQEGGSAPARTTFGGRGIVAAPFVPDPELETVAIFGDPGDVDLRAPDGADRWPDGADRRPDGADRWRADTLLTDLDEGLSLAAGELDDRNGCAEPVLSGHAGRVVLPTRPSGFGLPGSGTPHP